MGYSSDLTTGGTATASSTYASLVAGRAIDDNAATEYAGGGGTMPAGAWWQVQLTQARAIKQVRILPKNVNQMCQTLKVQASNNGTDFVDIAGPFTTQSGNVWHTFNTGFSSNTAYSYWRLTVVTPGANGDMVMYEVEMMESDNITSTGGAVAGGSSAVVTKRVIIPGGGAVSGGLSLSVFRQRIRASLAVPIANPCMGGNAVAYDVRPLLLGSMATSAALPFLAAQAATYDAVDPLRSSRLDVVTLSSDYTAATMALAADLSARRSGSLAVAYSTAAPQRGSLVVGAPLPVTVISSYAHGVELPATSPVQQSYLSPYNLGDVMVLRPNPTASILHNGVDITDLVSELRIIQSEGNGLDQVEFSTIDQDLYNAMAKGDQLQVTINAAEYLFSLDEIDMGGKLRFGAWGRSPASVLDAPEAAEITIETDGTLTAAGLAADVAGAVPLSWTAADLPLPIGWSMTGTPLAIISRLAQSAGAIIRPAGSGLTVIPRFAIRPVDWSDAAPAATYHRDENILSLSWKDEVATAWGSVLVSGQSPSRPMPKIEIEEQSPQQGDLVHVRVYPQGRYDYSAESLVTAGAVDKVGSNLEQTISDELVSFSDYKGGASYPIGQLLSFSWVGDNRGDILWLSGGRSAELQLAAGTQPDLHGNGLARITYTTAYDRYQLSGHMVEALMLVYTQDAGENIAVRVSVNGAVAPEAPALTDELLTTPAAAMNYGRAWLDSNRYGRRVVSMSAPHAVAASPGVIVSLFDDLEGIMGAARVKERTITKRGPAVIDDLEVYQCHF